MLSETLVASILISKNKPSQPLNANLKNAGVFLHEFQPQNRLSSVFQKSSTRPKCLAVAESHVFAAQADKAVINVYSREKGNQEATVPFPEKIHSLAYIENAAILILGSESGKLVLWETATGRITNSSSSHLEPVDNLCVTDDGKTIISGSADSSVHLWHLYELVRFPPPSDVYTASSSAQLPSRTFSSHRTAITSLGCGHSKSSTNFGVSTSEDKICYVWHIETCQTLRTVLLPGTALCMALDPADRAIYLGTDTGSVVAVDIHGGNSRQSLYDHSKRTSTQLTANDIWRCPSLDHGSTLCLSVVYDGTAILTGHQNGAVLRWDTAKKRLVNEVTKLSDSVTNLCILRPDGFPSGATPKFTTPVVVKPRLEFNGLVETGTCGIPGKYSLLASARRDSRSSDLTDISSFSRALRGKGISQCFLDDAIHAIDLQAAGGNVTSSGVSEDSVTNEALQDEVKQLQQQLAVLRDLEKRRRASKLERIKRREDVGLQRRKAYFEAKKSGRDGDAAMKEFEEKAVMIDVESDDELLGEGMDIT